MTDRYKCGTNPASALVWEWENGKSEPSIRFVVLTAGKHLDVLLDGREMVLSADFFGDKEVTSIKADLESILLGESNFAKVSATARFFFLHLKTFIFSGSSSREVSSGCKLNVCIFIMIIFDGVDFIQGFMPYKMEPKKFSRPVLFDLNFKQHAPLPVRR